MLMMKRLVSVGMLVWFTMEVIHLKIVILGANGGSKAVITPVNFGNGTTLTLTNSADYAVFAFDGAKWWAISHNGTIA